MAIESVFVLNDIEKYMAEELILKIDSGTIPAHRRTTETNDIRSEISYEYISSKQEKTLRGLMLDCRYKLRYRDRSRIFFSAWDCNDVCSVFYDVMTITRLMADLDYHAHERYYPFEVDLHVEDYVFFTGPIARSFIELSDYMSDSVEKVSCSSQYISVLFQEPNCGVYDALIAKLKAEGYNQVQVLQVWIRGEILYYAIADGVVLRSRDQRSLTPKEEADLIRKIHKTTNELSRTIDLTRPDPKPGA